MPRVASSTAAMEAERVGFVVVVVAWRTRGTATGAGVSAPSGGAVTRAMSASTPLEARRRAATPASSAFVSLAVRAARSAWSLVNVASIAARRQGDQRVRDAPGAPRGGGDARGVVIVGRERAVCGPRGRGQTLLGMRRAGSVARLAHLEFKLG